MDFQSALHRCFQLPRLIRPLVKAGWIYAGITELYEQISKIKCKMSQSSIKHSVYAPTQSNQTTQVKTPVLVDYVRVGALKGQFSQIRPKHIFLLTPQQVQQG